jgi:hypothetical protein
MATWEGRSFALTLSSVGEDLIEPETYRFQFVPVPGDGTETYYYKIVPESDNVATAGPKNPFEGRSFFPQTGRKLTRYIPTDQRLDEESFENPDDYKGALQALAAEITGDKIDEDPCGYERLVGFVTTFLDEDTPVDSPVMFYQVENVFTEPEKLMLIVKIKRIGANPSGTIVVQG